MNMKIEIISHRSKDEGRWTINRNGMQFSSLYFYINLLRPPMHEYTGSKELCVHT